jgi:hypothetical protein
MKIRFQKLPFEFNLYRYNEDGGVKLAEKVSNFVWLMKNAIKNAERTIVVKAGGGGAR